MAAVAGRPLAPLPSSSKSSINFISRTSPRILRSRPSNHPIPSKPPFPSKPSNHPELSNHPIPSKLPFPSKPSKLSKNPIPSKPPKISKIPITSRPPEPSKHPIPFKPSKPKTVTRCNLEIKSPKPSTIPTSVSGRISFMKTPKPRESDLHPRWNSSTKVDYDWKGNLRLQPRSRLPTPDPPMNSQKLHSSKPTKDHQIPISADMPPLKVCASPEIVKATLEAPKTTCFTDAHLIDRVEDGTRGRLRGLLTVGGPMLEVIEGAEGLPPLMKASMLWFSPPSGSRSSSINNSSHSRIRTVLFRDDDSVKPRRDEERSCPSHVKPSRDEERSCPSPVSETPESLYSSCQFPTNGGNTSPFSLILKRAAAGHWGFLSPSSVMHQNGDDMADKEAKLKEKELIMETAKDKHNAEQQNKRLDPEFHKEMLQTEKEVKSLQDEAPREEKCREIEEVQMKKQLKKQQEEAEKDQCYQETEESELRKLLKKQQEEAEKDQCYPESEKSELKKLVKKQQEEAEDQCYQQEEEWEEKEPGENLSDCDKDDEEDQLDEACHSKIDDEDASEGGFFLPEDYVSKNEGCNWNDMEEDAKSSQSCKRYMFSDEFRVLMRQQKWLNNLIEQALRKNQTLVILSLMHDKSELVIADPGKPKFEQACQQALCMLVCPGATSLIDVSTIDNTSKEVFRSQKKTTTYGDSPAAISKSDMSKFIWSIWECSQGIMLEGQEVL